MKEILWVSLLIAMAGNTASASCPQTIPYQNITITKFDEVDAGINSYNAPGFPKVGPGPIKIYLPPAVTCDNWEVPLPCCWDKCLDWPPPDNLLPRTCSNGWSLTIGITGTLTMSASLGASVGAEAGVVLAGVDGTVSTTITAGGSYSFGVSYSANGDSPNSYPRLSNQNW